MMRLIYLIALFLLHTSNARPTPGGALHANLAYRSPSKQVSALAIDTAPIQRRIKRDASGAPDWYLNVTFPWGVASGDPLEDSVILSTVVQKLDPDGVFNNPSYYPVCLHWIVVKNGSSFDKANYVSDGHVETTNDVYYAVKTEATGLSPSTAYAYRFEDCVDPAKGTSRTGYFKTLPAANASLEQFRIATFSCSNLPYGFFNAYGYAANRSSQLDLWTHVGDYIYEYRNGDYGDGTATGRIPQPQDRECASLQDYRDRYASYRRDPDLQNLHANLAVAAIWDDHEVADNTYKSGSADSNDTAQGYINGLSFSQRKANAVRAYFEWMPIRQVDTDDQLRIWRTFQIGKLADMIMLDTRQYNRSITDLYYNTDAIRMMANDSSPGRSMTGAPQQSWFYSQLQESESRGANWRLVMQQVVFNGINYTVATNGATDADYDAWDGYQSERRQITSFLKDQKINGTVILSGDSHASWVSDTTVDGSPYNATTGEGAVGVEFAGSAVSSPSSYGKGNDTFYVEVATALTSSNPHLQYAEGQLRGYFELTVQPGSVTADYYGFYQQETRNSNVTHMGTFAVDAGANHLRRPINNGTKPALDRCKV